MNCISFPHAFQNNMNALGIPAPLTLFSSLSAALKTLGSLLNGFKSVGSTATVAELIAATKLEERFDSIDSMAATYYIGAVIGSILVAGKAARACKGNISAAHFRDFTNWMSSHGALIPIQLLTFMRNNPEVIEDSPRRKSYAMRARQHGAASRSNAAAA